MKKTILEREQGLISFSKLQLASKQTKIQKLIFFFSYTKYEN